MNISVTRALTEVKHLDDRIRRATMEQFVGLAKGSGSLKVSVESPSSTVTAVEVRLRSNFQSVSDMINRRERLKRAIIKSNSVTQVTIGTETFTVAEAIEKKASIVYLEMLVANLRSQFVNARNTAENINAKLMAEIDAAVQQAYGNDKGKVDEDQYSAVANPRLNRSQVTLVDPNAVEEKIAALETQIANFKNEVDFVLSESNARTEIEVD